MIYDAEGTPVDWEYLDVNRAFGDLSGLQNIAGKRVLEAIPDIRKLTPELFDTYGRVAMTGNPEKFEIDFLPLGKWLNVSVFSPQTGYFVAVFEDITERKRAEAALQKTTEELNQFFAVALDLLCIADQDGYFRKLNRAWETTLGYSLEDLMAHRFLDFVHPDDLNCTLAAIAALKDHREVTGFENRYRCSDGSYRWIEWRSFPYGNLIYAAARDITQRKLAEDELRKARDFYLKVLDDFPNPIWRADVSGKCDYFNKDWLSFTGRSLDQELGDGWAEGVHPDDLERCLKIFRDNFALRKPFEMEYRLRYHDGSYHWLYDSGKPFYSPDGKFSGYIGSYYDIQERRQAEEALLQVNRKLNLLSSITRHDINNQLFSLKAFLELSKETLEDTARTSEYIIKAERAANAIERQIVFTKEYQDLGVKAPVWQNIDDGIKKAVSSLPLRDIRVIADVPGSEVYADPLLEKVFYNLIENALRYGGPNMTEIRITAAESDGGFVIAVQDNGSGISAEDKKRLFERGFGKHTGLGLFLSREILSITGITIRETGEQGAGARFEIFVPKGAWRTPGKMG
jgi:PAS domain S-box-containing protein